MGNAGGAGRATRSARLTRRAGAAIALALVALALTPAPFAPPAGAATATTALAGTAAPADPVATVSPTDLVAGQSYVLRGRDFPPGIRVDVATCTFTAGSSPCDQATATSADVSPTGELALRADAGRPASGCPCVLRVSTPDGTVGLDVPVNLDGVAGPDAAALARRADTRGTARVVDVHLDAGTTVGSLFGAAPVATLAFTVENTGATAIADAPILLSFRHDGSGEVPLASPPLGQLAPGQQRSLRVAVPLGSLAFGSYSVSGHITGLDGPVSFTTRTSSYPWGLIGLGFAVMVSGVGLLVRWRRGRRRRPAQVPLALAAPVRALGPGPAALPSGPVRRPPTALDLELEPLLVALLTEVIPTLTTRLGTLDCDDGVDRAVDQVARQVTNELAASLAGRRTMTAAERGAIERHLRRELGAYVRTLAAGAETAPTARGGLTPAGWRDHGAHGR